MKVGDIVIALVPLYLKGRLKTYDVVGQTGTVVDTFVNSYDGFVADVIFNGEIALGCVPGRHVELHPANGSPLMEALK